MRRILRTHRPLLRLAAPLLTLWAVALPSVAGQTTPPEAAFQPAPISPEHALQELDLLKGSLETLHPGYERYATPGELEARWGALRREAAGGTDADRWYLEISRLLATLRCEHSRAETTPARDAWRQAEPTFFPFHFRILDGRLFVEVASEASGLERGDEVVAIDGRPSAEILAALRPLVPVDGWGDSLRDASLEDDGDFLGSTFEQFHDLVFGHSPRATLTVRRRQDQGWAPAEAVVVRKIPYLAWSALKGGGARYSSNFKDAVHSEVWDDGTAYLRVDTFVNYREPVDPVAKFAPLFQRWNESRVPRLVVDLRNNGGGSTDAQIALLRFLVQRPIAPPPPARVKSRGAPESLRPHLSSWNPQALHPPDSWFLPAEGGLYPLRPEVLGQSTAPVQPHPDHFRGQVLLLTSVFNASGTTNLLAVLKDQGDAVLIGQPTGGNVSGATAGILAYLELPHSGIKVRVPLILSGPGLENADRFQPDRGIQPDILVPRTLEAFLEERDETLQAARAWRPESK